MKNLNEINVIEISHSEKVEITGGGWGLLARVVVGAAIFMFNEGVRDARRG